MTSKEAIELVSQYERSFGPLRCTCLVYKYTDLIEFLNHAHLFSDGKYIWWSCNPYEFPDLEYVRPAGPITLHELYMDTPLPKKDFPHKCGNCGSPAYFGGINAAECTGCLSPRQ